MLLSFNQLILLCDEFSYWKSIFTYYISFGFYEYPKYRTSWDRMLASHRANFYTSSLYILSKDRFEKYEDSTPITIEFPTYEEFRSSDKYAEY